MSLGKLFSDYSDKSKITEANHLFIKSIYESSGYFEFDSCQNFATFYGLDESGNIVLDESGNIVKNPSNADGTTNFTVYRELGTSNLATTTTMKHGQFLPYDIILPGVYSTDNPVNLYSALAVYNDGTGLKGLLDDSDPRKYEQLYMVCDKNKKAATPNYSNGMELTAQFVQTVDGLDAWDHDIIFEFTGDDDFWLYVDGELVIDLGGNHSALAGNVNFRTGVVYVDGTTTDLRSIFKNNYETRNPAASEEDISAYLDERFAEGKNIFKDYSAHTMHVYYMERGKGASNLHMRFNLSSVTPGNVVVTKNISGEGADLIDKDFVEYPFQIRYKQRIPKTDDSGECVYDENGEVVFDEYTKYLDNSDPNIGVKYQGSELDADYAALYKPPGSNAEYTNVFFINPTKNTEISFPENTIEYELIECAVSSMVYPEIRINNQPVTASDNSDDPTKPYREENDGLLSYHSGFVSAEDRPTIIFDNHVADNMVSTLKFTKILKDKNGNLLEYVPEYRAQEKLDELKDENPGLSVSELKALYDSKYDSATFDFRLFISPVKVPESEIDYAHLYKYYIVDNNGYVYKRDSALFMVK